MTPRRLAPVLLACTACHRQYDVADLAPGRLVRCVCGALNRVARGKPRRRAVEHCGNCGAELPEGAKRCEHCEARVTRAEEGRGEACPECSAILPRKARFCSACGVELSPSGRVQALLKSSCLRCGEALSVVEGKSDPFHQCTACGGMWLSRKALRRFVDRAVERGASPEERRAVARSVATRKKPRETRPPVRCPVCGIVLRVIEFAAYSGVLVDECLEHGWWFDAGELDALEPFLRGGGLEEAHRRLRKRRSSRALANSWRRACERNAQDKGLFEVALELLTDKRERARARKRLRRG